MHFWRFLSTSATSTHLHGHHNATMVVLSAGIAMVAAFTALAVVERIVSIERPSTRRLWLLLGAVAMGIGVWAMHFTAMLAFELSVPVSYDSGITFLSLLPSILGSAAAIGVLSRRGVSTWQAPLGGIPMVMGIGGMHFVGMEAMRMPARLAYRPWIFLLSLFICYALAVLALWVRPFLAGAIDSRRRSRALAAVIMGLAVTGMHHTAMMAAVFVPAPSSERLVPGLDAPIVALLVGIGSIVVGGLTLVATLVDERLAQAAESVSSTELRHRTVLELMSECILTFGADGRVDLVNRAGAFCFGYEAAELIGEPIQRLLPEITDPTVPRAREALLGRCRDGSEIPVEVTLSKVDLADGTMHVAVVRDTTVQRRRDEAMARHVVRLEEVSRSLRKQSRELKAERDRAQAATRAKSDFLATMSHEIRTPMNGIIGTAEMLLDSPLSPEQSEQMCIIRSSGEALLQVINDILDFSKIEAGRLDLDRVGFDLASVVDAARMLLAPAAEKKGIDLVVRLMKEPPRLIGDPLRLRQIILNLVSNAIKFTDEGAVTIEVYATRDATNLWRVRFTVRDTGIGISPEAQGRLFTAFSQADASTTRKYGGTGLGLAISKRLAETMGGSIGVDSQPGVGSTFWVEIPLPAEPVREVATVAPKPNTSSLSESTGVLRVLLAEDNATNQKVATLMIKKLGFEIEIASNGAEAVSAWRRGDFDLILMDCQMPEMDGFQATQAIRQAELEGAHMAIVAVTANAMEGDRERCLAVGMDDYVSKPLSKASIQAAITRLIDKGLVTPHAPVAA
jgi:PAS domain S-box-containing protein